MQRIRESGGYPQSVPVRLRTQLGRGPSQESALTVLQQTDSANIHAQILIDRPTSKQNQSVHTVMKRL